MRHPTSLSRGLQALLLLREYAGRIISESSVGLDVRELEQAGAADSELR